MMILTTMMMMMIHLTLLNPVLSTRVTESGGERSQVGDNAGRDEDVADEVIVDDLQKVRGFRPSCLFASQPTNQLLGSIQLLAANREISK